MVDRAKIAHIKKGKPFSVLDIVAIVSSLAVCVILMIVMFNTQKEGETVEITRLNEGITISYSLSVDREIAFDTAKGEFVVIIKDKSVYVKHAPCDGKDCEDMGKIKYTGQTIICADLRIKIVIKGSGELVATT